MAERTLLYPGPEEALLTGLPVQMPATGDAQRDMESLVERYLAGPVGEGQVQPFLDHSALRSLYLLGGNQVVLDLTGPVRSGGGSDTETARVYGLVNTLALNFPAVASVRILVDGQEVETLLGHMDLSRPIPPEPRMLAASLRSQLKGVSDAGR
jgi:spore germination protein GerM